MTVQRPGAMQGLGYTGSGLSEQDKQAKVKSPGSAGMSKDQKLGIESRLSPTSPWFLPQLP